MTVNKSFALNDSGTTQYLSRADNAAIRIANGWTFEAWVLLNQINTNAYILYSRSGENGYGITFANPSGENVVVRVEAGSGSYTGANGTVNIYDGKFHHIRVYFNGASTKLYIDGVLDSTLNIPTISNPNATVYFGTKATTAGTYPTACLSLMRIWDNEHTAADSTTIYGTATSNMKAEWSLDGVLTDASGNSMTLTANGSPTPTYLTAAPQQMQVGGLIYVGHHDDSNGVQSGTSTNTKEIYVAKAGSTVVVAISSATSGDNHGTPTLEGVSMTQIQSAITGTNRRGTLWYIPNIGVGAHTLSISPSSISNRYSWGFVVLENVKTSSPIDVSAQGGNSTGTSRTASLTLTAANSAMLVWNFNLYDAGTNSTKLFGTGDDHNLFSNCDAKSSGSFSMTATSSSTDNAYVAVAFLVGATNVTVTPSALALSFSVPAYTVKTGRIVFPSVLAATFSLPSRVISLPKTVLASVLAATFSIPAYSAGGIKIVTPNVLSATFSIPSYTVSVVRNIIVAVNALVATFSTPSRSITQGAGVTVLASALTGTFSVPAYTVSAQRSIIALVNTVTATFSVPTIRKAGGIWTRRGRSTNADWTRVARNSD